MPQYETNKSFKHKEIISTNSYKNQCEFISLMTFLDGGNTSKNPKVNHLLLPTTRNLSLLL